jgi:hypothetical protein
MPVVKTDLEHRLWCALKRITCYESAERLVRNGEKEYGVDGHEVLEMSYENMQQEAKNALRGVRARKKAAT